MAEADWLSQTDIGYLLRYFQEMASRRKLRLFAVACTRDILHLLDQNCRIALEMAEQHADGGTNLEALKKLHAASETATDIAWRDASRVESDGLVCFATRQDALAPCLPNVAQEITKEEFDEVSAIDTIDALSGVLMYSTIPSELWGTAAGDEAALKAVESERPKQLRLFRDIFTNPFHPVTFDPSCLTPDVKALAQRIYTVRTFDQMPTLADELEKAGCANEEILGHCRGPGPHVRGCWVVDLVLGKA
jgi:hypothetical protein